MTVADQLREEGHREGHREGRQQGRQETQRSTLLKLLRARFGELPEAAVARVNRADAAELDLWFERGLTAQTLADVLDET